MAINLLRNSKVLYLDGPEAAGSSIDSDSAIVDTANFEGVIFITGITDSAQNGVATMTVEQNTANSASGMAALGASAVATATSAENDDLNGLVLAVDVYRPRERYLRVNRTSATANIAYGDVVAVLYGPRTMPVTQSGAADTDTGASPAEA